MLAQKKWREREIEVNLIGAGAWEDSLQRLCGMCDVRNVSFLGYQNDISAVWSQHHALVLPSRYEGLPLALVEAMLCQRPCILTDVAGHAELVEDGKSGFLASAPTVRHFDEALESAWQRRDDLQTMGQYASQRIRQIIPRDPALHFASTLLALVGSLKAQGAS